jgi:hypothetical protein
LTPETAILPTAPVEAISFNDTIQSSSPGLKVSLIMLGSFAAVVLSIIVFVILFKTP